jgi:hypothetical protein
MSSVGVVVRTSICSTVSIISTSATESFAFDIEKPKMVKAVKQFQYAYSFLDIL